MKTVLRRKDNTSIFCPSLCSGNMKRVMKTKVIEATIGCTLLVIGLYIMINI